jgi:hypothetical protein
MTRAFDAALRAAIAACALLALLAVCATYLCAAGAMPCRDTAGFDRCPYDDKTDLRRRAM